jgi:glyoxylate reductase
MPATPHHDARIVVTRPLPGDITAMLREQDFVNVWCNPEDEPLPRAALLKRVPGAHGLVTNPGDKPIDAEVFDAAGENLRVVANYAVGTDNIDLEEATRRGIRVGNTPDPVTEPTADIAWLLLLGAARRAYEGQRLARSGQWTGISPNMLLGQRVLGGTLLIVGAGRIGKAVARRSVGWNMTILYHARTQHPEFEEAPICAPWVDLDEGLARADFVSLHTPLTPDTRHLIDARRLGLMKPAAVLVNTARGPVVDEAALVEALRARRIAAAGLDVYEREPHLAEGLADLDNAYLLPHVGSATVQDRTWMTRITMDNLVAGLTGAALPYAVG